MASLARVKEYLVYSLSFLIFALTAVPALASAATTADLQAQIAVLEAQLQVLQGGSTAAPVASSVPSCLPTSIHTLTVGSTDAATGGAVTQLQAVLANQGLFTGTPTGYFGTVTMHAVQNFQVKNGIVTSGSPSTTGYGAVGPHTIGILRTKCGAVPVGSISGNTQSQLSSIDSQSSGLGGDMSVIQSSINQGDSDDLTTSGSGNLSNGAVQSELANIDSLMQGLQGDVGSSQSSISQGDSD